MPKILKLFKKFWYRYQGRIQDFFRGGPQFFSGGPSYLTSYLIPKGKVDIARGITTFKITDRFQFFPSSQAVQVSGVSDVVRPPAEAPPLGREGRWRAETAGEARQAPGGGWRRRGGGGRGHRGGWGRGWILNSKSHNRDLEKDVELDKGSSSAWHSFLN